MVAIKDLAFMLVKLTEWALAVTVMVITRVENNILTSSQSGHFSLDSLIFITTVVYGFCILLTAQVVCLKTWDRAPHQVHINSLKCLKTLGLLLFILKNLLLALCGFGSYLYAGIKIELEMSGKADETLSVCAYLMLAQTLPMLIEAIFHALDVRKISRQGV